MNKAKETYLFDRELFDNIVVKQQHYIMGVDTYDKKSLSYCLARVTDGITEIILCKKMNDNEEFEKEVENLAKYFEAIIVREDE